MTIGTASARGTTSGATRSFVRTAFLLQWLSAVSADLLNSPFHCSLTRPLDRQSCSFEVFSND